VYQITATAIIAMPSQFQWPVSVSAVKMTMATAQRVHCAVLFVITTYPFAFSVKLEPT
jgi:hypothetical protein